MIVVRSNSFPDISCELWSLMRGAPPVKTERWQGVPLNTDTLELRSVALEADLKGIEDLDHWRSAVQPNLPWADDHFLERVGGEPINPGVQWANWPWGQSANRFRGRDERFNHNYMERLWPKFVGRTKDGALPKKYGHRRYPDGDRRPRTGINNQYVGDLLDLVELLAKEPHTRQAVIPLFFPEDTGVGDGGRKMCSLLYNFTVRDGQLHLWYPLRSCDLRRHFQDDAYLAVRMLLWVLDRCRELNPDFWSQVRPGTLGMHATSLHVFQSDATWLEEMDHAAAS